MDQGFLSYITCWFSSFTGDAKRRSLLALRDNPDRVTGFVRDRQLGWSLAYVAKSGEICVLNPESDSPIIVEHLKRHFAEEIQALPPAVPTAPARA